MRVDETNWGWTYDGDMYFKLDSYRCVLLYDRHGKHTNKLFTTGLKFGESVDCFIMPKEFFIADG